jgi:hypothetical protein
MIPLDTSIVDHDTSLLSVGPLSPLGGLPSPMGLKSSLSGFDDDDDDDDEDLNLSTVLLLCKWRSREYSDCTWERYSDILARTSDVAALHAAVAHYRFRTMRAVSWILYSCILHPASACSNFYAA